MREPCFLPRTENSKGWKKVGGWGRGYRSWELGRGGGGHVGFVSDPCPLQHKKFFGDDIVGHHVLPLQTDVVGACIMLTVTLFPSKSCTV